MKIRRELQCTQVTSAALAFNFSSPATSEYSNDQNKMQTQAILPKSVQKHIEVTRSHDCWNSQKLVYHVYMNMHIYIHLSI